MEFARRDFGGATVQRGATRQSSDAVSDILAAYGVEPARNGARPEAEDEEPEERRKTGSSGMGGTRRKRWSSGDPDRQALINKYPALQNGRPN